MNKSNEKYYQRGLGLSSEVQEILQDEYSSQVVDHLRSQDLCLKVGRITFRLSEEFGFCYGVKRAVQYAYQVCRKFPDRRIYLTGEIIHNPRVNARLRQMGVEFLDDRDSGEDKFSQISPEDVVIIPAFGVPVAEFRKLKEIGCILVDTTCGSVLNVWKNIEQYAREDFTSIIHGKYQHEETKATSSRTNLYPSGCYLVVWDISEAQIVCEYIVSGSDKSSFLTRFAKAYSEGFDPDTDLQRIGIANQTTMLSSESFTIASMLQQAIIQKYGEENLPEHFRMCDTICSATQDRQDAVLKLINNDKIDIMIVVGGYNSSNTNNLADLASKYIPTYHVDNVSCIVSSRHIRHKPVGKREEIVTEEWLPDGKVTIGITAGASTPNSEIGEVIEKIIEVSG